MHPWMPLKCSIRYLNYLDFVSQMLKVICLKISFKTRYMKKAVRMVGLSITYSTLQPTYKHAYAYAYAHALYLYISLQISSGKKKNPFISAWYKKAIFTTESLRAFKMRMCLGIFNSTVKVSVVLIVADREGYQPKKAKSSQSWWIWLKDRERSGRGNQCGRKW